MNGLECTLNVLMNNNGLFSYILSSIKIIWSYLEFIQQEIYCRNIQESTVKILYYNDICNAVMYYCTKQTLMSQMYTIVHLHF